MSTSLQLITPSGTPGPQWWPGGAGTFDVVGTFDSASVQLQFLGPDGATWLDVGDPLTQAGGAAFALPHGQLQASVTGAGGSTSLTASAASTPAFIRGALA